MSFVFEIRRKKTYIKMNSLIFWNQKILMNQEIFQFAIILILREEKLFNYFI